MVGAGTGVISGVAAGASVGVGASVGGAAVTGAVVGATADAVAAEVDAGAVDAPSLGEVDAAGEPPRNTTRSAISAIAASAIPPPIRIGWIGTTTFGGGGGAAGSGTTAWRSEAHFQQNVRVESLSEWQTGQAISGIGSAVREVGRDGG